MQGQGVYPSPPSDVAGQFPGWHFPAGSVPLPRAWNLGSGGGSGWQGGQRVFGSSAGWGGVGRAGPVLERTQQEARPGPGCWAGKGVGGQRRPQGRVQAGPTLGLPSRRSSVLCWPRTSTQTRSTRRRCGSWTAPAATASRGQCSPRTGERPRPLGASPDVLSPRRPPPGHGSLLSLPLAHGSLLSLPLAASRPAGRQRRGALLKP